MGSFGPRPKWADLGPRQVGFFFEAGSPHPPTNPEFGTKLGVGLAAEMGSSEAYEPRAEPDPRRPLGGHGA